MLLCKRLIKQKLILGIGCFFSLVSCQLQEFRFDDIFNFQKQSDPKLVKRQEKSGCQNFSKYLVCSQNHKILVFNSLNNKVILSVKKSEILKKFLKNLKDNYRLEYLFQGKSPKIDLYLMRNVGSNNINPLWVVHFEKTSLIFKFDASIRKFSPIVWGVHGGENLDIKNMHSFFKPRSVMVHYSSAIHQYDLIKLSYFLSPIRAHWGQRPVYEKLVVPLGSEVQWVNRLKYHPIAALAVSKASLLPANLITGDYIFVDKFDL